jgi:large subunit ribosomal protein L5
MAEDKKEKAEKPEKAEKAPKAEKQAKPEGGGEKKAKPEGGGEKKAKAEGKGGGEKKAGKGKKGEHGWELAPAGKPDQKKGPARLRLRFEKELLPALMKELGLTNRMEVPRVVKVVVNMGLGEAISNPKILDGCVQQLAAITGQKPVITRSRKAISNFKLRAGQQIGAMVTMRSDRAWEFIDRLVNVALPRVRDFKGVSPKAFDGRGNYTLGLREQIIFPEINYDQVEKIKGLNVSIVTTARNDEHGRALLKILGMPFRAPGGAQ